MFFEFVCLDIIMWMHTHICGVYICQYRHMDVSLKTPFRKVCFIFGLLRESGCILQVSLSTNFLAVLFPHFHRTAGVLGAQVHSAAFSFHRGPRTQVISLPGKHLLTEPPHLPWSVKIVVCLFEVFNYITRNLFSTYEFFLCSGFCVDCLVKLKSYATLKCQLLKKSFFNWRMTPLSSFFILNCY